jgi:hypothetical protein
MIAWLVTLVVAYLVMDFFLSVRKIRREHRMLQEAIVRRHREQIHVEEFRKLARIERRR